MSELDELRKEIAALKARLSAIELRLGPAGPPPKSEFQRINPLDRLSVPQEVIDRMAEAVPGGLKGL